MQIKQMLSTMQSQEWLITLDCDAERGLTDDEIGRIAENCVGTIWNHKRRRYALKGRDFGPAVKGKVEVKRNGDRIEVMIDFECIEVRAS